MKLRRGVVPTPEPLVGGRAHLASIEHCAGQFGYKAKDARQGPGLSDGRWSRHHRFGKLFVSPPLLERPPVMQDLPVWVSPIRVVLGKGRACLSSGSPDEFCMCGRVCVCVNEEESMEDKATMDSSYNIPQTPKRSARTQQGRPPMHLNRSPAATPYEMRDLTP